MKSVEALLGTTFSGRRFTRKQLAHVQETVEQFPNLSRAELAHTLCEHLNWKTPNGKDKIESCLILLEKLEAELVVSLPAKQARQAPQRRVPSLENAPPETPIKAALSTLMPIRLEAVGSSGPDREQWKGYLQTFHYLGYRQPVGPHLAYFIVSEPCQHRLGCLLFSASAAWALAPRDRWIGWDSEHRKKLLPLVLSNDRFLIFPWVDVPNLASHALSLATRQIGEDWVQAFGYRPVLIETFVDPTVAGKLLTQIADPAVARDTTLANSLSQRERDVLRLLARGLSNTEIANQLYLSEGTIRNYVSTLFEKLGVSDRTRAALIALRHGLAD